MRSIISLSALPAALLAALVLLASSTSSAQPADVAPPQRAAPPAAPPPADAPPAGAGAPPDSVEQEQSELRRQLEDAQASLEAAAREIARLSAELAAPVVGEVTRRFGGTGPRAMLGLSIEDAAGGVRVVGVSPNGPSATAGLETGDLIVAIGGARLDAGADASPSRLLLAQMREVEPGDDVGLTVQRDGREMNFTVAAREVEPFGFGPRDFNVRLRDLGLPRSDTMRAVFFGSSEWRSLELVPLTPELGAYFGTERGLLVVRAPDDPALGLRDGDVILDISGREPSTPEHAMRILASFEPGETLRMTVMREQRRETLEFVLPEDRG